MKKEEHYLMYVEDLKTLHPELKDHPDSGSLISRLWHINSKMLSKFGDGKKHTFQVLRGEGSSYTHKCLEDGFFYHYDWFVEMPIKTTDPEPQTSLEPIQIEINDLEIPEV